MPDQETQQTGAPQIVVEEQPSTFQARVMPVDAVEEEEDEDSQSLELSTSQFKKLNYKQVEKLLNENYNCKSYNQSTICDIIAMYLKGQKILYMEARTVCEQRLHYLMLPAILITSICSILSLVLKEYGYGPTIVSSLNGVNAFLLALVSYLKLDGKAEAHRTTAYKFDKLQSNLEFNSGKNIFMSMSDKDMIDMINNTESEVREIKETNQFILPENIRYSYPRLYSINVFAEVKKIQNIEMVLANKLKDILNELGDLKTKKEHKPLSDDEEERSMELEDFKNQTIQKIIELKDDYLEIDSQFEKEMKAQREQLGKRWQLCGWLKT